MLKITSCRGDLLSHQMFSPITIEAFYYPKGPEQDNRCVSENWRKIYNIVRDENTATKNQFHSFSSYRAREPLSKNSLCFPTEDTSFMRI